MRKFLTLMVLLVALTLTSVGVFAQLEDPEPAPDAAFVRIAHLSPGTAAVKAFVDGESRISGLAYGTVTRWLDFAPGTYTFAIGTTSDPAAAQIADIQLELAAGSFTTLAAVGSGDTIQGLTIVEDFERIPSGQARATVINAIEGAGAPVNFAVGGTSVFDFVAFPGSIASADGFTSGNITPGAGITVTGVNNGTVYAEDADRELVAGHNYLIAAAGTADDVRLVVIDSDQAEFSTPNLAEGEARVRVAHLSSATAPVTVFVDGTAVLSGIRFGSVTRFLPVSAGEHEIAVGPNSNIANAVIGPVEMTFEDGSFTTIAAIDDGDGGVTPVVIEDFTGGGENVASATIYHGIPGGPSIDVWAGDTKLIEGLAFAGSFALPAGGFNDGLTEVIVPAGEAPVYVTGAFSGSNEGALLDRPTTFEAGHYYLIAVVGTVDAPRLVVVDVDPAVDLED
jgi:hypothetical protein